MTRATRILLASALAVLTVGTAFVSLKASGCSELAAVPHCAAETLAMASPGLAMGAAVLPVVLKFTAAGIVAFFLIAARASSTLLPKASFLLPSPWTHRRDKHFSPLANPFGH